ncbi:MAG: site-specific integrase [Leeuwenhoekiella sp.]
MHNVSNSYTKKLDQNLDPSKTGNKLKKLDQKLDHNRIKGTISFTDLGIKNLKPLEKRKIYWRNGLPDFGVRVSPNGNKTWIYQYRFDNKTRRMGLGRYPQISLAKATKLYFEAKEKCDQGVDPLMERENEKAAHKEELTLEELVDIYISYCQSTGQKCFKEKRRTFKRDLTAFIKAKKISEVSPNELALLFNQIIAKGAPSTAQHLYSYTRRLFNFAADMGYLRRRDNPCSEIRLNLPKKKRQRHLSPKEIYLFWHNLENVPMSPIMRLAMKFLLLTVARSIEVRTMTWSQINFNERIWTMPTSKNGKLHRVYLGDLAIQVLNEVKTYTGGQGLVFGSPGNYHNAFKEEQSFEEFRVWSFSQPFRRHFSKFGIEERFYPHDLRRTGATLVASLLGRRDFAAMVLNHSTSDVTDIYDQYIYDDEKKRAFDALNKAVQIIVNSKNAESVPDRKRLKSLASQPDLTSNHFDSQSVDFIQTVHY